MCPVFPWKLTCSVPVIFLAYFLNFVQNIEGKAMILPYLSLKSIESITILYIPKKRRVVNGSIISRYVGLPLVKLPSKDCTHQHNPLNSLWLQVLHWVFENELTVEKDFYEYNQIRYIAVRDIQMVSKCMHDYPQFSAHILGYWYLSSG